MDALKRFDKELLKINSYSVLGSNVVKYICSFFVIIEMLLFPSTDDGWLINLGTWLLFDYAVGASIQPLIYIKPESFDKLPIFTLIRDTPVDRNVFIRSRIKHLLSYAAKLISICIIVKILAIFAFGTPSLENIFWSIFWIGIMALTVILSFIHDIYRSTHYKRE